MLISGLCMAQNNAPVVSNLRLQIDDTNHKMYVYFDVSDAENDTLELLFSITNKMGVSAMMNTSTATGDIGYPHFSGQNKMISFNYDTIIVDPYTNVRVEVYADDRKGVSIAELVAQVDTNRLRADMDSLVGTRHYTLPSQKLQSIKDTMVARFNRDQLQLDVHSFQFQAYQAQNFIGTHTGHAQYGEHVIIDGHYDCVSNGPGADDNLSAVVGVLEASRILSKYSFHKSIKFIGFDLEELGLLGSKEYVKNGRKPNEKNVGVLNFEMIGYYSDKTGSQKLPAGFNQLFPQAYATVVADSFRGNFITNVGNVASSVLVDTFNACAKKYVPELKVISVKAPGKSTIAPDLRRSDHAAFWDADIPAIMLTDGANFRNKNYHSALDVVDSLNVSFIQNVVKATIATAASIAKPMHAGKASIDTMLNAQGLGISKNKTTSSKLELYPNPAKDYVCIRWPKTFEAKEIQLYDSQGQLQYCSPTTGLQHYIFTEHLPAGLYTLRLMGAGGELHGRVVTSD